MNVAKSFIAAMQRTYRHGKMDKQRFYGCSRHHGIKDSFNLFERFGIRSEYAG